MDFLYNTVFGRILLKILLYSKTLSLMSKFAHSEFSKIMIKPYIKKNNIDMSDFKNQEYKNFADFFARKRTSYSFNKEKNALISPCDGLMSIYSIDENKKFCIKNSWYTLNDLLKDKDTADYFNNGICFIIRLRASDYHHFCYIDNCYHDKSVAISGTLHSVQPAACGKFPVYKLNKRVWSRMYTENFETVVQIEVGAVLVGGIVHAKNGQEAFRGEEMGNFELAGSTIILLFNKNVKSCLQFDDICNTEIEIPVKMGQAIGFKTEIVRNIFDEQTV